MLVLVIYISINSRAKIAVDKADSEKAITEGNRSVAASVGALADSVKSLSDNVKNMLSEITAQRIHAETVAENYRVLGDARTRQFDKQLIISGNQAETLNTIAEGQTKQGLVLGQQSASLGTIQSQGEKLADLPEEIKELKSKLDALPEKIRETLPKEIRDALANDFKVLSDKIDGILSTSNAPTPPIQNNITVTSTPAPETPRPVEVDPSATGPMPKFDESGKPILP